MAEIVLVVDGEEAVREIVTSMLRSGGYECRESPNGLAALALLGSGARVDLVLSEVMMPELDGIGLLERVKEKYPNLPFAVITAVHDDSIEKAALSRGACGYLLKPFESERLLAMVRRALGKPSVEIPLQYPPSYDHEDGYWSDDDDDQELESRVDEIEQRLDRLGSSGDYDMGGAVVGYSMGMTLAMILSWSSNSSILWCMLHGVLSWFYVIYWIVVHRFLG
jgi:two-component system chemotaxis response regulator CheY